MPPVHKFSYGVALVRFNQATRETEYLAIRRRSTFEYIAFVMHPPSDRDPRRLLRLLNRMTNDEKLDLLSLDFARIYYRIWMCNPEKEQLRPEQHRRYLLLRRLFTERFCLDGGLRLRELVQQSRAAGGIWELPKGRKRNAQEPDLNCAIRELGEETGVDAQHYSLLPVPATAVSHHDDGVCYSTTFFFAIIDSFALSERVRLDYFNRGQLAEVAELQWVSPHAARYLDASGRLPALLRTLARALKPHCAVSRYVPHLKASCIAVRTETLSSEVEGLACLCFAPGGSLPASPGPEAAGATAAEQRTELRNPAPTGPPRPPGSDNAHEPGEHPGGGSGAP